MLTASIINSVVTWATTLIGNSGLPAVFFLMLLESALIPVPSEAIMPFAGFAVSEGKLGMAGIIVAGVAGNLVGSWIAYASATTAASRSSSAGASTCCCARITSRRRSTGSTARAPRSCFFGRMIPIVRTFISCRRVSAR